MAPPLRYVAVTGGVALFLGGGAWDVSWHILIGRDTFWSPPHLLLYAGVLTILAACGAALSEAVARQQRRGQADLLVSLPFSLRLAPGILVAGLGATLSLVAAPIDDLWHRLYGLDVTMWSPPHITLIAGMVVAAFGALIGLTLEANRHLPARLTALWRGPGQLWTLPAIEFHAHAAAGVMLVAALSILAEYEFDFPRYAIVYQPVLLAGLGATILVLAARATGLIGAATLAALVFTALRLVIHVELVLLDGVQPQIPLVLAAAPVVDVVLVLVPLRPYWLRAALAGIAFGIALIVVQVPYLRAYDGVQWTPATLTAAVPWTLVLAAGGGALGWLVGSALRPLRPVHR